MGSPLKIIILFLFIVINILAGFNCIAENQQNTLSTVTITIPPHSNNIEVARRLVNAGVLASPWRFLLNTFFDRNQTFKPGKYVFKSKMSTSEALKTLQTPRMYKITIPEGLNVAEIARLLNEQTFLMGGIFQLPPEGMLLPETYVVRYGEKREALIKRLEANMKTTLKTLWHESAQRKTQPKKYSLKTKLELLTLASIVEKETGIAPERAHIAGVFFNRLSKNMRLQSDPTVSYAITNGKQPLGRLLTRKDLTILSPINTYTNVGLPPQPIACPGKAALLATLAPTDTNDLYFVADGTGGHRFSETLDGHNINVNHWRKIRRNQKR